MRRRWLPCTPHKEAHSQRLVHAPKQSMLTFKRAQAASHTYYLQHLLPDRYVPQCVASGVLVLLENVVPLAAWLGWSCAPAAPATRVGHSCTAALQHSAGSTPGPSSVSPGADPASAGPGAGISNLGSAGPGSSAGSAAGSIAIEGVLGGGGSATEIAANLPRAAFGLLLVLAAEPLKIAAPAAGEVAWFTDLFDGRVR
jgi:hypothetical protein